MTGKLLFFFFVVAALLSAATESTTIETGAPEAQTLVTTWGGEEIIEDTDQEHAEFTTLETELTGSEGLHGLPTSELFRSQYPNFQLPQLRKIKSRGRSVDLPAF